VSLPVLKVAVVGHTNTGKTSLLRTLTRDAQFGEVCNRAATTRHVEGATLLVNGEALVELYDTPGLEDSISLLEHLDELRTDRRTDWLKIVQQFLVSPAAQHEFEQEAKALRQVLACDVALYVVDARDRVLSKHRDELEILGYSAKPIVPVLNFVASPQARSAQWREHLARVNMHAVVEFDTVVLNEFGEQRLFEKMQTLLDTFRPTLDALIQDRRRLRTDLIHASAELLADLLIDVAAYTVVVPMENVDQATAAVVELQQIVRQREQQCVNDLLKLHRFRSDDYAGADLPIEDGQWGMDLFNPASLQQFGIRAGGAAAAGAAAGLALDVISAGLTLGTGAAVGAAVGALFGGARSHGKRIADRVRGFTELRVNDATLRLLAVRQSALIQALLQRGHAAQDKIRIKASAVEHHWLGRKLPGPLRNAKVCPAWSRLQPGQANSVGIEAKRMAAREELARLLASHFTTGHNPN